MRKIGFDPQKYIEEQSKFILERVNDYDKLYLEFGGKLIGDMQKESFLDLTKMRRSSFSRSSRTRRKSSSQYMPVILRETRSVGIMVSLTTWMSSDRLTN